MKLGWICCSLADSSQALHQLWHRTCKPRSPDLLGIVRCEKHRGTVANIILGLLRAAVGLEAEKVFHGTSQDDGGCTEVCTYFVEDGLHAQFRKEEEKDTSGEGRDCGSSQG